MGLDQARRLLAVVEDDQGILDYLSDLIVGLGYEVILFNNARTFISYMNDPDQRRPTAILSDIMMPGMTGLQLLQELRKNGDALPVVFLTGSQDLDFVVEAVRLGATDFIFKPSGGEEIEMVVSRVLELGFRRQEVVEFRKSLASKYPVMKEDLERLENLEKRTTKFQALNATRRAS